MPERNDPLNSPLSNATPRSTTTSSLGSTSSGSTASSFGTTTASETSSDTLSGVADKAREMKDRVVEKATDQAEALFDRTSSRATDTIGSVASALRQTAHSLQNENQATAAHYIEMAADRIDDFGVTMRGKDLDELMYDVQSYARSNPAVFFGGALAIGFLAARFLKASSRRAYSRYGSDFGYEDALYRTPSSYDRSFNTGYDSYGTRRSSSSSSVNDTVSTPAGLTYGEDL